MMDIPGKDQDVILARSVEEALVLCDWLACTSNPGQPVSFVDQAEQRVLWDMECMLETALVAPDAIDENRKAVRPGSMEQSVAAVVREHRAFAGGETRVRSALKPGAAANVSIQPSIPGSRRSTRIKKANRSGWRKAAASAFGPTGRKAPSARR